MSRRTGGDVEPAPGRIFWLPANEENKTIPDIEIGRLGHPVLILTSGSSRSRRRRRRRRGPNANLNIQVVTITSFSKQLLQDKFPDASRHSQQRERHIPIGRGSEWSAPHPDSGIILDLDITGNPDAPGKDRQSYVCLEIPSRVAKRHLKPLLDGTAELSFESLLLVVEKINQMHCTANIPLPVKRITPPAHRITPPAQRITPPAQRIAPPVQKITPAQRLPSPMWGAPPPMQTVSPTAQSIPPRLPCGCHSNSTTRSTLPTSAQYYAHVPPPPYSREWAERQYAETMSRYREHSPLPRGRQYNKPSTKPQPAEGARTGTRTKGEEESPFSISKAVVVGSVILVGLRVGFKAVFGR